jgi:HEAT repeat protein
MPLAEVLLNDPVAEVRARAAWALGEIEDPRAEEALSKAMKDESAEVRRMAIWALGEIGG